MPKIQHHTNLLNHQNRPQVQQQLLRHILGNDAKQLRRLERNVKERLLQVVNIAGSTKDKISNEF